MTFKHVMNGENDASARRRDTCRPQEKYLYWKGLHVECKMFIVLDECNHGHGVLRNVTPTSGWGGVVCVYIRNRTDLINWVFEYS